MPIPWIHRRICTWKYLGNEEIRKLLHNLQKANHRHTRAPVSTYSVWNWAKLGNTSCYIVLKSPQQCPLYLFSIQKVCGSFLVQYSSLYLPILSENCHAYRILLDFVARRRQILSMWDSQTIKYCTCGIIKDILPLCSVTNNLAHNVFPRQNYPITYCIESSIYFISSPAIIISSRSQISSVLK